MTRVPRGMKVLPQIPVFLLLQWKYAIQLEGKGLRHSSGRSVNAHAANMLGLPLRSSRGVVLSAIEDALNTLKGEVR